MNSVILVVLDGFGIAPPGPGNTVYLANPPFINSLFYTYPNSLLKASGESVGLPSGEVGNTEVGHINLGAGRIVYQDLPRINMSIADGSFFKNDAFLSAVSHVRKYNSRLHLIGLIGDGGVHSSIDHLIALFYFAKENNITDICVHAITDGRDSPPKATLGSLKRVEEKLNSLGIGKIASISGRYYTMDRDLRWDRTEKSYLCLTKGVGNTATSITQAISESYAKNITDEFIEPTNIIDNDKPVGIISENDAVIFFNFRIDRPRQITKAFVLDDFENQANISSSFDPYYAKYHNTHVPQNTTLAKPFQRGPKIKNLFFVTMTEYEKNLPTQVAFLPVMVQMPLGRIIAEKGLSQLRMAESEKERFVTYYFNGQRESPFPFEERIIIPSPKVPTYDLKPEMSAYELTSNLIQQIRVGKYPFILINFANPDMVGHTGNIQATIQAIKTLDNCLAKIVNEAVQAKYSLIITADHGNAEQKINPQTGEISTEHTNNQVPFIAIKKEFEGKFVKLQTGILADIAPTILALMEISKPESMTGRNLLEELRIN